MMKRLLKIIGFICERRAEDKDESVEVWCGGIKGRIIKFKYSDGVRIRFQELGAYRDIPMRITPCCAKLSATATEKLIPCIIIQQKYNVKHLLTTVVLLL